MTKRQWSLVIFMILLNYIIFSQLIGRMMDSAQPAAVATPTIGPTFTPLPTPTPLPTATFTPIVVEPTVTNTPVILTEEQKRLATETAKAEAAANQPQPTVVEVEAGNTPQVKAENNNVNLRSGPGTNYNRVGVLAQGESMPIVGRNEASTWWVVNTGSGTAWIAASVTTASNLNDAIPVQSAPAAPATNTPVPAQPTSPPPPPSAQYELNNMFGQVNEAITQIRGNIIDAGGNPVNGIRVRVRSGSFCTVAVPSGKPGVYPAGNYDVLLDVYAKPGDWLVAIVDGPADSNNNSCDGVNALSEEVVARTNTTEGVVFVEWRKNY